MPKSIYSKSNDQFLAFLTFLFVITCYLLGTSAAGAWVLLGVTLLFLVLSNFKMEFEVYHLFILQFVLYAYATSMWAFNYHTALSKGNTLMIMFICQSVMYCHFKRFKDVTLLMNILMWAGYLVVIYAYFYYGIERVADVGGDEGRLSNSFNNINALSMLAATVVVINCFFIFFRKATWSVLFVLPSLLFVASSQSRKSIVIVILGIGLLYFLKYLRVKKRDMMPFVKLFGFILLFAAILLLLSSTSMFENVTKRFMGMISWITGEGEMDTSTEIRVELKNLGWEQFKQHPFFGIGMGCVQYIVQGELGDKTYLHDNYAELAANGGLFGLISYYSIFLYLFFQERKYLKVDDMANLVFTLIVIRFVTDMGAVSYFSKTTYMQLMIYFLHLASCRAKYPQISGTKVLPGRR